MLVEQNSRNVGPLTPVSSPGGTNNRHLHHHHHHIHLHHNSPTNTTNLSPQNSSSASSTASCNSSSGTSDTSSPMRDDRSQCTPVKEEEEEDMGRTGGKDEKLSALQRLQFALEKNTLFSGLYNKGEAKEKMSSEGKTDFGEFARSKMLSPQSSEDEGDGGGPIMATDYTRSDEDEDMMMMVASPDDENGGSGGSGGNNAGNIFECPLCSVTCNSRHQFNEHLVS